MEWYDLYKTVPDPQLAEFQNWQRPRDLIAHLSGLRAQGLVNGLLQRLENGFLPAAAGRSSWRDERAELQTRYAPVSIQAGWWQDATDCRQHWQTLWTLGDIGIRVYDISRGEFIDIALTSIRFEASSLYADGTIPRPKAAVSAPPPAVAGTQQSAPEPTPTPAPKSPEMRPRLSDSNMDKVSRLVVGLFEGEATELFAHRVACAAFPNNHVPREYFFGAIPFNTWTQTTRKTNGKGEIDACFGLRSGLIPA